MRIDKK